MEANTILYPAIAMFFMTFAATVYMGLSRFNATKHKQIDPRYYKTYQNGDEPPELKKISRHAHNHFETPPLFYASVIMLYISGNVTTLAVSLAWLYVAFRALHSYIHLGRNNVLHRFYVFIGSLLALAAMWGTLLVGLLA